MTPPVLPSPVPPDPGPESTSGFHTLTRREYRLIKEAQKRQEEKEKQLDKEIQDAAMKHIQQRTLLVAAVSAISIAFGAFFALRAEARDITDGGVKMTAKALADHIELENLKAKVRDEQMAELKSDTKDIKAQNAALLKRFDVKNPAPEPKDGGHK